MKKVFLGGTCNGSTWRNELIPKLTIDYFNPVVDNWKEENYKQELIERIIAKASTDKTIKIVWKKQS